MSIIEQNKAKAKGEETVNTSEDQIESTMEVKQSNNLPEQIAAFCKRLANQISSPPPLLKQRLGKEDAGNLKKLKNEK